MHVVMDARMVTEHMHGIARVLVEVLRCWQRDMPANLHVTLLTNQREALRKLGLLPTFGAVHLAARPFTAAELGEVPRLLGRSGADLYHATSIAVPRREVVPTVVTVNDLLPLRIDHVRNRVYAATVLGPALRHARRVMTSSEFVKADVLSQFSLPPERVAICPYAASEPTPPTADWRQRLGIGEPFLLCVGNPKPHKNVVGAIRIFERVCELWSRPLLLVIGSGSSPAIEETIRSSRVSDRIVRHDFFAEADLAALYDHARVFVYPSYYEGFGLPPIEAMRHSCPVVCSNRASLPEVVGEGGLLIHPDAHDAFAQTIVSLLRDEPKRAEWARRGFTWQKRFSWEETARLVYAVYEAAVAHPRGVLV